MRVSLRHAGLGVQEMANDRVTPSKQTMRLWALRTGVPFEWLKTGKAPTSPSGPGSYTTRDSNPEPADLESMRARRTARSAVEVERVAA